MAILGVRGTGQFTNDFRPTNYRELYTFLEPNGDAPLQALLAMMGSESTDDPKAINFDKKITVPFPWQSRLSGIGLIKGAWQDPGDDMPMTRLLVQPAVAALCPSLATLTAPNSGIYLMDRSRIAHTELRGNYAVDLDAMLRMAWAGHGVTEVDIGQIENDKRNPAHYSAMAHEIMRFFLDCARNQPRTGPS